MVDFFDHLRVNKKHGAQVVEWINSLFHLKSPVRLKQDQS